MKIFLQSVNGEIVFIETLSDSVNYYCKADFPYSVTLYGKEINLHICVKKDGFSAVLFLSALFNFLYIPKQRDDLKDSNPYSNRSVCFQLRNILSNCCNLRTLLLRLK